LQLIKKILSSVITMFLVSVVIFLLFQFIPGDPILAKMGENRDPALEAALRSEYGLDKPAFIRYISWLFGILHGNFGVSIRYSLPVSTLIAERLPATLFLSLFAFILFVAMGIPLGVLAANLHRKGKGFLFNMLTQLGIAIPPFYVAMLLILIFSINLNLLPVSAYVPPQQNFGEFIRSIILPAVAVSLGSIAVTARYTRNSFLEELSGNYVRTAISNGISKNKVLYGYVLRNALVPIITILGLSFVSVLTGSMVVESVFSIPGIGSLLFTAINDRDLPLVQGITVYISAVVIFGFLILDIIYGIIDPRIRTGE
jgi:ABC-type dipeptide/oligopeptide/nickel transport systems, permease components